jgi:peptide/nickel transport system ATP-binding protein
VNGELASGPTTSRQGEALGRGEGDESGVVLAAESVSVDYLGRRVTHAVRGVSFVLHRGEILGIAGESGCGKSTLAYAVAHLLRPPAVLTGGRVLFTDKGTGDVVDVMALGPDELRRWRWSRVAMVFQSAMSSLNPVTSLRKQFGDIFKAHAPGMDAPERDARARELLDMVGISPDRVRSFPHELSGGMRQRVGIAMALALRPDVVVMDEPTTALDVVVQREILDEVARLQAELGFSVIFITHDVSLLLEICDRLVVMYAGEVVESGPANALRARPAHPYTQGLLRSTVSLFGERQELRGVPGSPPDLRLDLEGCSFAPRCEQAFGPCARVHPGLGVPRWAAQMGRADGGWEVACHLHDPARAFKDGGAFATELDGKAASREGRASS